MFVKRSDGTVEGTLPDGTKVSISPETVVAICNAAPEKMARTGWWLCATTHIDAAEPGAYCNASAMVAWTPYRFLGTELTLGNSPYVIDGTGATGRNNSIIWGTFTK